MYFLRVKAMQVKEWVYLASLTVVAKVLDFLWGGVMDENWDEYGDWDGR